MCANLWVLETEPSTRKMLQVLLTIDPLLYPQPHSRIPYQLLHFVNVGIFYYQLIFHDLVKSRFLNLYSL